MSARAESSLRLGERQRAMLEEMRRSHQANIAACEAALGELPAD